MNFLNRHEGRPKTYGKFDSVLQLVVTFELGFHISDVRLQTLELVDLHQLTGHHALAGRLPVGDLDLVALHLVTRAATHVVKAAAYRRLD